VLQICALSVQFPSKFPAQRHPRDGFPIKEAKIADLKVSEYILLDCDLLQRSAPYRDMHEYD
jgi:hypothetical protein